MLSLALATGDAAGHRYRRYLNTDGIRMSSSSPVERPACERHRRGGAARTAAPATSACPGEPARPARSRRRVQLVALHSTDAATVFLSTWARTRDFAPEHLERALYEERALVRMLGMRRTLWVVPQELAPVVDAACTRAVAARERRRLEQFVAQSGVAEDPSAWIDRAAAATLDALAARGEAFTSDLTRDDPLLAHQAPPRHRNALGGRGQRRLAHPSAARGRGRCRPRTAARLVGRTGSTAGRSRPTAARTSTPPSAQAELLHRWLRAFGPGDRDGHPLVDGLDGARGEGSARGHIARRRRARRLDRLRPRRRPRARRAARARRRAPAHARPDDDGLEAARLVPRPARGSRSSTPTATPGRRSGGTGASSAAGRSGEAVRSRGSCSRTSAPRPRSRSERRPSGCRAGSATHASRPGSCRRSSARSRADRHATRGSGSCDREAGAFRGLPPPQAGDRAAGFRGSGIPLANKVSPGRSPSRSRAAGSARCPRRSGTASRRASASRPDTP